MSHFNDHRFLYCDHAYQNSMLRFKKPKPGRERLAVRLSTATRKLHEYNKKKCSPQLQICILELKI